MSTHSLANTTRTKRAFAYLRVSSDGQVNTGYSRDGLSIDSQRDEAEHKAVQLDAEIVRTFLDPGKSAFVDLHKRTDFLEMLDEVKKRNEHETTRIDYIIVWISSRWARNVRDHFHAHDLVRAAGARLISITEPMIGEDTPEAFWMEGMAAVNNQYESMRTSRAVQSGLQRKAMAGGSYGGRRLGYIKTIVQLSDGRQISGMTFDPDRHHFMTYAFQLYATGEFSIPQLSNELYRLGLRSRPWKNHPAQKVGTAMVQRILRNPYYAGWIVYKRGTPDEAKFKGRHPALIDQETFDKVQVLLDEKRIAGERPRKRQHYLRGSIFCAGCGSRLTYGISTGENGRKYPYYFCASRVNRTPCSERRANVRPEFIEAAIVSEYAKVELTYSDLEQRKAAINAMADVAQESKRKVREAKTELIDKLKTQQQRLIRLHSEEGDDVSPDAFRAERARMAGEIKEAEKSLAETETRLKLEHKDLCAALELAGDVQAVYMAADEQTRRGYNQAFFTRIKIKARWDKKRGQTVVKVAGVELTEPYALLLANETTEQALAWAEAIKAPQKAQKARKRPLGTPSGDDISIYIRLAEGGRFELPRRGLPVCRFSRPVHSTALPPFQGPHAVLQIWLG
jgi:site-specific DNA recombinase